MEMKKNNFLLRGSFQAKTVWNLRPVACILLRLLMDFTIAVSFGFCSSKSSHEDIERLTS